MKHLFFIIISLYLSTTAFTQNFEGPKEDLDAIQKNARNFSKALMNGDTDKLVDAYTEDAKLFPSNHDILSGEDAVRNYWSFSGTSTVTHHKLTPIEIKIAGDEARDYGYFEGTTQFEDGTESSWKGKYLVIWKKVDGDWKMYLDIWNSNPKEQ